MRNLSKKKKHNTIEWNDNIGFAGNGKEYSIFRIEPSGELRISGPGWKKSAWTKPAKLASCKQAKRIAKLIAEIEGS